MTGILQALLGSVSSAAAAATDAYFNLVTLLLPGDGTNGAQNNTFLDSSTNNFTITRNGNTTQGTFSPFSQTGWGNFFDGTDDRLSVPDASKLELGSGAFTIECFAYNTAWDVTQNQLFEKGSFTVGKSYRGWMTATAIVLEVNVSGTATGAYTSFSVSTTNNLNQWYHIAFVRSGNSIYIFKDGVQIGSTGTLSGTAFNTSEALAIGGAADGNNNIMMNGYISNFRIITGQALATGTFSIPTAPLSTSSSGWTVSGSPVSLTGTVALLTCQSNRFVDNSASPLDITVGGGTPSVQAFSPFAPTAAYSAATVGGSGYFDGTGDYLTIADNAAFDLGTADFTFECWVYKPDNTDVSFICSGATGLDFAYVSGSLRMGRYPVAWDVTQLYTIPQNSWTHIAFIKASGRTYLFANGALLNAGGTANTNSYDTTTIFNVGVAGDGTRLLTGYMTGVRLIKGQALATANFTPPTAPVTTSAVGWTGAASSITGTVSLLLNFTNAGITDATAKNVLETVGGAQISTTQSKFGGSSMYFDGTGDGLILPASPFYNFLDGNFTVEAWVYIAGNSPLDGLSRRIANIFSVSTSSAFSFNFVIRGDGTTTGTGLEIYNGTNIVNVTGTISQSTWHHIAVTKSGTSVYFFLNGTQMGTTQTTSGNWGSATVAAQVGRTAVTSYTFDLNGYIDDLRVTRFARYTANFTAPTSAFALQ